ncbi:unnamed protein product [Colias eurytheme]|nr:unnamed protein product [Colias eurytheme]
MNVEEIPPRPALINVAGDEPAAVDTPPRLCGPRDTWSQAARISSGLDSIVYIIIPNTSVVSFECLI